MELDKKKKIAIGVAVVIIAYLVYRRSKNSETAEVKTPTA